MVGTLQDRHYRIIRDEVDKPVRWQRVNFGRDWI